MLREKESLGFVCLRVSVILFRYETELDAIFVSLWVWRMRSWLSWLQALWVSHLFIFKDRNYPLPYFVARKVREIWQKEMEENRGGGLQDQKMVCRRGWWATCNRVLAVTDRAFSCTSLYLWAVGMVHRSNSGFALGCHTRLWIALVGPSIDRPAKDRPRSTQAGLSCTFFDCKYFFWSLVHHFRNFKVLVDIGQIATFWCGYLFSFFAGVDIGTLVRMKYLG